MLSFFARDFLLRRMFGARRSQRGYGRGRRSGFGLMGPFPTYSRRTRGGGRVSCGGCCLPIPLALAVAVAGLGRLLFRR